MTTPRTPTPERTVPADPLAFIMRCVRERRIYWTYHVNMRLAGGTALASVGIEVDPNNQRLKRRPAVRFKSLRAPFDRKETERATPHLEEHEPLQRRAQSNGVTG
ncbi:MAG: hypothetical protein OXG35_07470 [Acidobacteria bacterium]|nr:hypothetical protein [Acidobacteriota bacterium]